MTAKRSRRSTNGKNARETRAGGRGTRAGGRCFRLADFLAAAKGRELRELHRFWGEPDQEPPSSEQELRRTIGEWMSDPDRIERRITSLDKRQAAVVEDLVRAPRYQKSWEELTKARALASLSDLDLEACVSSLARQGLVLAGSDRRFERFEDAVIGLPHEVGDGLLQRRRQRMRGIFGVLTLRGHLDLLYSDPERAKRMTPQRLRELYKMYSQESASVARIERLPDGVRGLVEKAILEFGGILPRHLFERMETELPHWNGRRWGMILEQSLLGTVQDLDLSAYGIKHRDETLLVFNEVALAWLRRVAVPGDPDDPYEELSRGVDVASNVSRFLAYLDEHDVRFTVKGEIFKTTERKILQHLIPNPGREIAPADVLSFLFRFARQAGLIDRTGKRTFSVTAAGREWSSLSLFEKHSALFDFALRDRAVPGEPFHQERMRQIFLRLLKRVEPGIWYDLMYLPFIARNTYLSTLDDLNVSEHFAERTHRGNFPTMADPQRLAWNLVRWVRERLYLLGIVDLGYDKSERLVAMRLTPGGARLLGVDQIGPTPPSSVGSIIVTPDFEVVLFPTGDDTQLVHDLDRFCVRETFDDSLMHFRVTHESVTRALKAGVALRSILELFDQHSRTPVPQNVRYSIRDWALRAGLMQLSSDHVLTCKEPDVLRRFLADPGTRGYVAKELGEGRVQLRTRATPRRTQALLRELGYLVELADVP